MKQSEKILLSVMGVVVLYAGYLLLLADDPQVQKAEEKTATEYETFVEEARKALEVGQLTEMEAYRVEVAGLPLVGSPFYESSAQFYFTGGDLAGESSGSDAIIYNGYLRFGRSAYAIINGIEYAAGDNLAAEGYRLTEITKKYVVIERKDTRTGKVFRRQVPLVEEDTEQINLKAVY